MKNGAEILLWVNAVLFILFGVGFMFAPTPLATWITGSSPSTTSGAIDLRATYGGLAFGLGIFWAICASNGSHKIGLLSAFLVLASVAIGRIIGMIVDGSPNGFMFALLIAEVVFAATSLLLYKQKVAKHEQPN